MNILNISVLQNPDTVEIVLSAIELYGEKAFDLLVDAPTVHEERHGGKRKVLDLKHASLDPFPQAQRVQIVNREVL